MFIANIHCYATNSKPLGAGLNKEVSGSFSPLLVPEISISAVAAIIGLSLAPFLLILLGVDFGADQRLQSFEQLALLPQQDMLNNLHLVMVGPQFHTLLEWSAIVAAILTALLAFSHFSMTANITTPVIGISLLCAGAMDAFHSLVATRMLDTVSDSSVLAPFSWAVARTFNALIVMLGVSTLIFVDKPASNANPLRFLLGVTAAFVLLGYLIIQWCISTDNIPKSIFPDDFVRRPFDVLPLVIYIFTGAFIFPKFKKRFPGVFSDSLVLSTVPAVILELHMVFGSASLYDSHYYAAHMLKVLVYMVPFLGLLLDYYMTYRKDKLKTEQLHRTYRELEERTQQLTKSNKNLEKTNQYRSEFLASMSHELRTPLNSIIGFSRILRKDLAVSDDVRGDRAVQSIFRNSTHLLGLINDILDLSKIDAGRMTVKHDSFTVSDIVSEITAELLPLAEEKKLDIKIVNYARNIAVMSDRTKLKQIMLNLGSNAIKYTERGSVIISVEREKAGPLGNTVKIGFKDTGIGIADSDKDKLFTEFGRAEEVQKLAIEGTGLGLMITAKLTNLLGGFIDFDSEYGVGSEFRIYIPVNYGAEEPTLLDEGQWDRRGLSFLYIDNSTVYLPLMEDDLKHDGFTVFTEQDPVMIIKDCEENLPDIVGFDMDLPELAGSEILRRLYGHHLLADIPKVAFSTNPSEEKKIILEGADLFVCKPWEKASIAEALIKLVYRDFSSAMVIGATPLHKNALDIEFSTLNIELIFVETAEQALHEMHLSLPDFLVINLGNPTVESTRLMVSLNNDEQCRKLPQVLYNGMNQERKVIFSNDTQEELALVQPDAKSIFSAIFTLRRRVKTSLVRIQTLNRSLNDRGGSVAQQESAILEQEEVRAERILVVEDSRDNSELVGWILEGANIHYDCVYSGREALKQVLIHSYSLLLLDINLPDIDGREITRRLRATKSYRDTPIIAVTSLNAAADTEELKSCGIDTVIPKPVDQDKLLATLRHYLK